MSRDELVASVGRTGANLSTCAKCGGWITAATANTRMRRGELTYRHRICPKRKASRKAKAPHHKKTRKAWRKFHPDHQATEQMRMLGMLEDKRSFIAVGGHAILWGIDKSNQRSVVFLERGPNCAGCGRTLTEESFEWHHVKNKLSERCDCIHNSEVRCHDCHKKSHVQTQFKKGAHGTVRDEVSLQSP